LNGFALLESPHPLGALMPLAVLSIANWIILLGNLVPWSSKGPTGPAWSDGAFLARLLVMSDRDVRLMQAGTELREWGELREARDYDRAGTLATAMRHRHPDLPELQSFVGVSALDRGSPLEARACFRAALDGADTPAARAISQSNVAYADFVLAMDDLRAEADRLSAEAMSVVGEIGAIRGTRGSVLVWLGRADEGIPLLERAFEEYDDVRARAGYACTLAMGFTALGDARAAERWLDIAARLDPDCPIFTRAEASASGVRPRLSSTGC
jgi:tetratricopeptide (TPR) repeat protein